MAGSKTQFHQAGHAAPRPWSIPASRGAARPVQRDSALHVERRIPEACQQMVLKNLPVAGLKCHGVAIRHLVEFREAQSREVFQVEDGAGQPGQLIAAEEEMYMRILLLKGDVAEHLGKALHVFQHADGLVGDVDEPHAHDVDDLESAVYAGVNPVAHPLLSRRDVLRRWQQSYARRVLRGIGHVAAFAAVAAVATEEDAAVRVPGQGTLRRWRHRCVVDGLIGRYRALLEPRAEIASLASALDIVV
ncbi:hypothetical protein XA68_13110 [Ophiocordyceps unilateralis]|uniref:Uncharacterized protein n=1 Tax=Ophiocordyceps unilateralis TaxID=268505 RepID=A0A2A9PD73_OPHUN|nr:hypothetical protein XA68_13110 [Ophiocordyceps unilateralis]